jgi:AcrR family transcriptional regulator
MRADAVRNRQRVLDAAQTAFAEEGLAVPIDEIARRAGVGAGTVYRHFPTKEALYEAILLNHVERLTADAVSRSRSPDPGQAFFDFLAAMVERGSGNRALAEALAGAGVDVHARLSSATRTLYKRLDDLLVAAQRDGAVNTDVSATDLRTLLHAIHLAVERQDGGPEHAARLLTLLRNGLQAR